jgi:hypothetical protein
MHGMKIITALLLLLALASCATVSNSPVAGEATPAAYTTSGSTKGVVILAVNWSRRWGCGGYQNAEIMSLGFDRLSTENSADVPPEVFLDGPSRLTKKPGFDSYALIVEPGEYALSSFDIKVARSARDVGRFVTKRTNLIENGKPKAGSFQVEAGEIIYIGHFFLDCYEQPIIWRYYAEGRDAFVSYLAQVKQKYPFIDPSKVTYRLFRTSTIGRDYELPK